MSAVRELVFNFTLAYVDLSKAATPDAITRNSQKMIAALSNQEACAELRLDSSYVKLIQEKRDLAQQSGDANLIQVVAMLDGVSRQAFPDLYNSEAPAATSSQQRPWQPRQTVFSH